MRSVRPASVRAAATFLLAAGCAVPALAVAPAAHADSPAVSQVTSDDDGRLTVYLDSVDALWVQVSVRASAAADAPVLASTDDLTEADGRWTTEHTVSLPAGTAYGDYPVDVDYRLPGGQVQHWSGADHGSASDLDYRLRTGVGALSFDRDTLDWDHQTIVVSGAATTLDPATGTTGPARAGTTVEVDYDTLTGLTGSPVTATTGADGAFQVPLTFPAGAQSVRARVIAPAADTVPGPVGYGPTPSVTTSRYRISATESRTRANPNVPFTEQGSVQRFVNGIWQPWAGAPVYTATVYGSPYTTGLTGVLGHGTTGTGGTFGYSVVAARTTDTYTFVQPSVYLAGSSSFSERIAVPTVGSLTTPAASVDQYDTVTVSGSLRGSCDYEPLSLEYSANGKTGWSNLQWFKANGGTYNGTCSYKISKPAYWDGYYRVRHPETDIMQPVVSAAKRVNRTRTGVSVAMSSTKPKLNAKLTASGNVYQLTASGWKPYAGVHVVLVFKPKGDPNWYWVVKGYTNAAGHYTLNTKAFEDGTWGTYIEPDAKHYYAESKDVYVDAH
ncbi:hypothetical protein [Streptomyces sp. NBC_01190]|uniref:hypothetical protein n=1 Tax=Streptomyces sp. NBC_01190 TaxID=2903767 RepID=UPI003868847B|nr:hypothetical protein OG519_19910 [Streptomyces sp. NBC_01190]